MEGLAVKRRRVYSVESNRIEEAAFARKYVSYLVPALKKMKEERSGHNNNKKKEDEESRDSLKKVLKYEVNMALVLSADQASAWTNALKLSLHNNNEILSSSSSSSPSTTASASTDDGVDDVEEEEEEAMKRLRRLVPGGEEICSDQEMVAEFKSYVRCLQMQVNILQCLAQLPDSL